MTLSSSSPWPWLLTCHIPPSPESPQRHVISSFVFIIFFCFVSNLFQPISSHTQSSYVLPPPAPPTLITQSDLTRWPHDKRSSFLSKLIRTLPSWLLPALTSFTAPAFSCTSEKTLPKQQEVSGSEKYVPLTLSSV